MTQPPIEALKAMLLGMYLLCILLIKLVWSLQLSVSQICHSKIYIEMLFW